MSEEGPALEACERCLSTVANVAYGQHLLCWSCLDAEQRCARCGVKGAREDERGAVLCAYCASEAAPEDAVSTARVSEAPCTLPAAPEEVL